MEAPTRVLTVPDKAVNVGVLIRVPYAKFGGGFF